MEKDTKENVYNSEITKEDLNALGEKQRNQRKDNGDDQKLENRENSVDFTGKELDIPGRNLTENATVSKLKDEENQLYSQGGDTKSNLEDSTKK